MFKTTSSRGSCSRGFTLIELLVVISIGMMFILAPILTITISSTPVAVARVRLSNDLFDDLALIRSGATSATNILEIRRTDASGNFVATPETMAIASGAKRMAVVDMDNNNTQDIVSLHDRGTNAALLGIVRTNGAALSPQTTVALGITQPVDFASADINADGYPDIVTVSAYSVQDYTLSILKSTGPSAFAAPFVMHLPISQGTSLAAKSHAEVSLGQLVESQQASFAEASDTVQEKVAHPTLSLRSVSGLRAVTFANLVGDQLPDLVVAGADFGGSFVRVLENTQSGFVFKAQMILPDGGAPEALVTADFNLDGLLDIALADSSNNTVTIFRNLGGGSFASGVVTTTAETPVSLTVADLDDDTYPDLLVSTQAATTGGGALAAINVLMNLHLSPSIAFLTNKVAVAEAGAGPSAVVLGNFSAAGTQTDLIVMNVWLKTLTELVRMPMQ